MQVPAAELAARRAELQAAAESAGLSLDEIHGALNARSDLPRPLLREERDVLVGLLRCRGVLDRDALLAQADAARVVGYCACGCASVDFAVPDSVARATRSPDVVPAGADVFDAAGTVIGGLIVFLTDGYLSLLEIHGYGAPISPIPPLARVNFNG